MRTTRLCFSVLISAALALTGCRDEQAGPKRRPPAQALPAASSGAASAQPRVLDAVPSDLSYRSEATWLGGAVRYHGSKVQPPDAAPGGQVTLTHYFEAVRPPPQGYAFFAHVVDADAPTTMLSNADHEIANGAMPLERWPVGKIVVDEHRVPVTSPNARLVLGFWRGDSRLAVDQPAAHDGQNRVLGPPLKSPGAAARANSQKDLPEYTAPKARRAPVIDGDLSDDAWKGAPEVTLRGSFDGRTVSTRTTARLVWDDEALYVAFDVEDPDIWGTLRQRDDPIYTEEVVEIFLDANADGRTYNELQVSPHNVIFDAYFPARRQGMDLSWDSQLQSAVKVRGTLDDPSDRDEGWTVEMRIPYEPLAEVPNVPPRPGDRWRMNLYRLEHPRRRGVEGQSFSPLFVGDFHALPRFGWLVFGD